MPSDSSCKYSIAPWISIASANAIDFYKSAFEATEVYRHDDPSGGVVARLSVSGAEFWLSAESTDQAAPITEPIGGGSIRMILTVPDLTRSSPAPSKLAPPKSFPSVKDTAGGWAASSIPLACTGKSAIPYSRVITGCPILLSRSLRKRVGILTLCPDRKNPQGVPRTRDAL